MHIAILSPGSMPLPPAPCTSVEIYVHHLTRRLQRFTPVTLYAKGKSNSTLQHKQLTLRTCITKGGLSYARFVAKDLPARNPSLIHIENRIPFVPLFRHHFRNIPIVLNLHSNVLIQSLPLSTVKSALNATDALVVNSHFLKKDLLQRYHFLDDKKVHVIPPGIELKKFPSRFSDQGRQLRRNIRSRHRTRDQQKILLFVGRFIPRKGIDILLDAYRKVHANHPDSELWIIGGRPNKKTAFHHLIKNKAQHLPVRFLGFINQEKLPAYYAAADLFICPSQRPEAFGLVNLEAAAAGLPVIASDDWGIREAIADQTSGLLISNYRDPSAFARAICDLLADPDRLQQLGKCAHQWVRDHYSWKTTAKHFLSLYQHLQK
jgi:spore coat protein SA